MNRRYVDADMTVGDIAVEITATAKITLTGKNIDFIFIKPDGDTIIRDATSILANVAVYVTATGDIDQDGDWAFVVKNVTDGYEFKTINKFRVRPQGEEMAVGDT